MTTAVVAAFGRGVVSQFHPRMLALLLVPFVVAIVFWSLSAWYLWEPVTGWLRESWFQGDGMIARAVAWLAKLGLSGIDRWVPNVFAFLLLLPIALATALGLVAVIAMPGVLRHLGRIDYADVERRGGLGLGPTLWNLVVTFALFIPGYLLTLPLWFIPPLALIVPWLWWGWLTARLMRMDSLVEHATPAERAALLARDRRPYLLLGLAVAALNYVPPLFLVAPVLSALIFAHFSLSRLRELRAAERPILPETKR